MCRLAQRNLFRANLGWEMSEARQRMIRPVQRNLCGILSQLLTTSHNSNSIFEWKGVSQDAILQDGEKMKEIDKKLEKWRVGSCTKSIRNDLSKNIMIFSEESSLAFFEMGNMGWVELRQTSATVQCPSCLKHVPEGLNMCLRGVWLRPNQSTMDRFRAAFAALTSTTITMSRWTKRGHNQWQMDHQKAMDARSWAATRHEYTSFLDRWQNDEIYRASELAHGWTETWVKHLDYISKIDINMKHLTASDYDMKAHSTWEALIPTNKQDFCVNDQITNHQQMPLSAFNELEAKAYLIFRCTWRQDKVTHWILQSNNT